jgi:hypothetical protein
MKKLIACMVATLLLQQFVAAQITIQPNLPTVGMVQKSQLWNVLIVNGSNSRFTCKLTLLLTDRATGQEIMSASTGLFVVSNGTKQLNADVLNPIVYNFFNSNTDNRIQNLLPVGNYNACYAVIIEDVKITTVAEECVSFDVEPLSPPMLVFPADSSVLEQSPNQLSWIPPTPNGLFTNLRYEVIITPINDGQKPNEAIQENIPVYTDPYQLNTAMNYPAAVATLEKDKWYAWQVVARDDKSYAGKSEVWVFKIRNEKLEKIINEAPFIKVSNQPQATTTVHQGVVKLEYYHPLAEGVIKVTITNENTKGNRQSFAFELKVKPGQNFLTYDLHRKMNLDEAAIYKVMVENSNNEKYEMYFKPKKY